MLIKLSGNRYVNSECIESIDKRLYSESTPPVAYTLRMVSGNTHSLTQVQFEELLSALPAPFDAESKRKHKQAWNTVRARYSYDEWKMMDEDTQFDLVRTEVASASTQ